jgi:hypothetical protein
VIACCPHEILRRSRDRARLLWEPPCAITIFRASTQIRLEIDARDQIFLHDRKKFSITRDL